MRKLLIGCVSALLLSTAAQSETVRYSEMDRETEVYLQRGLSWPDYACLQWTIADMLWRYGVDAEKLLITYDDPEADGVSVQADESGFVRTCESGVLREWDAGDATIIHEFD